MKKFLKDEFEQLTPVVRSKIIQETINKANGEASDHSFDDIVKNNRHIGIAARMTSKAQQWEKATLDANWNPTYTGIMKAYTGQDIADIFIASVRNSTVSYYPLTGDWSNTGVTQLVLFVKEKDGYRPYARFDIDSIERNEELTKNHLKTLMDPTPALNCKHKSVLTISNVQTDNLPEKYLGLRSGTELEETAFKGSAPNVIMI